jgi:molybdopterin-guanine dinucleotide biosynthesis protein B
MLESLAGRIVGVAGWKDSGKTRVVEGLVRFLSGKGFAVGTIKHVHGEIALQPEAKDSMRHLEAGARCVVALGGGLAGFARHGRGDLEEVVARYLSLCDLIVVEGFKYAEIPKVAVVAESVDVLKQTENVVAVVCRDVKPEGYPAFTFDEIEDLGEFLLENGVLKPPGESCVLLVDGKPVPMNEFVRSSLAGVVRGFIATLRDVESPSTIHLTIKGKV